MTSALGRATDSVSESDLEMMVLTLEDLSSELSGFQVLRDSVLDNDTLAEHGFATATAERFIEAGRYTGFVREFGPNQSADNPDQPNVVVGTVAHLFKDGESVSGWMKDVFLRDFEENVGQKMDDMHELISAERIDPKGFFDEAVGIKAVQDSSTGLVSSTVIDFKVGRVLGVTYIGTTGNADYLDLATKVGIALEKRIVRTVLRTD